MKHLEKEAIEITNGETELEVTQRQFEIFYKPLGFKKKNATTRKRTTKSGE